MVETCRCPKLLFSVASIRLGLMPSREAVSRSMTRLVCRPLSCWSVFTSTSSGTWLRAARMRGSHSRNCSRSSAWSVNWYWAFDWRPPWRISWNGTRNRLAPGSRASRGRSRAMTWSALTLRIERGFSVTNMKPELRAPPPTNPTTFSTAGSERTIVMKSASFCCIDWNEVLWSAWIEPPMRPVSCCGKNPLGMKT
jgi:hypothetical protein